MVKGVKSSKLPILSVVIPVYNVSGYLDECLMSVKAQGFRDEEIEVITVNDGSTDGSELIVDKWVDAWKSVTGIDQKNQGLSAARNAGIKRATGTYIIFLDSDDVVPPGAYKAMVESLHESGSDFITGSVHRFKSPIKPTWQWVRTANLHKVSRTRLNINDNPEYINDGVPWNKMYRRDFIMSTGISFPTGRIYEDIATSPKFYILARSFDVLSQPVYYWRVNNSGLSLSRNIKKNIDRIWSLHDSRKFLENKKVSRNILKEYEKFALDYNLRRVILDSWVYSDKERSEILTLVCDYMDHISTATIQSVSEPLRRHALLAKEHDIDSLMKLTKERSSENHNPGFLPRLRSVVSKFKPKKLYGFIKRALRRAIGEVRKVVLYLIIRPLVIIMPIRKRTALFSSYWGQGFGIANGPSAVLIEALKMKADLSYIVAADEKYLDSIQDSINSLVDNVASVKVVKNNSLGFYYYLWRSKYLFNDVNFQTGLKMKDRYLFVGKRKDQIEVQTTHGVPFKKMGVDSNIRMPEADKRYFIQKNSRYTYLVSTSSIVSKIFSESHGINVEILKTGLPQNDFLFNNYDDEYKNKILKKYNLSASKKTILYAPTWRNKRNHEMKYLIDIEKLRDNLGDEYQLVIKPHNYNFTNVKTCGFDYSNNTSSFVKLFGRIKSIPNLYQVKYLKEGKGSFTGEASVSADINELMVVCDVFINDYSSTMFSFTHLNKPQIFFTPDIDNYLANRGSYFDVEEIAPGPVVRSTDDLIKSIRLSEDVGAWNKKYKLQIEDFKKKYLAWEKGGASRKILQELGVD